MVNGIITFRAAVSERQDQQLRGCQRSTLAGKEIARSSGLDYHVELCEGFPSSCLLTWKTMATREVQPWHICLHL